MAKTIREMIEVMEAFERGEPIECKYKTIQDWSSVTYPSWDWSVFDYRAAIIPDFIDWSHVNPMYNYMARDEAGDVFLYTEKPELLESEWDSYNSIVWCLQTSSSQANPFSSYKKGTIHWTKSLVERPS